MQRTCVFGASRGAGGHVVRLAVEAAEFPNRLGTPARLGLPQVRVKHPFHRIPAKPLIPFIIFLPQLCR